MLHDIVDAINVSQTLRLLLKDPSSVTGEVHENGFHKLTLNANNRGPVLRIHIWMPDRDYGDTPGNIHNHRWSFVSKVLAGSIKTISFAASSAAGQTYEHYLYNPDADPQMMHVGSAKLKCQHADTYHSGQCYYLDAEVIHQAEPLSGQPTVTLIARSGSQRSAADVYSLQRLTGLSGSAIPLSKAQALRDLQYVYELVSAEVANNRRSS